MQESQFYSLQLGQAVHAASMSGCKKSQFYTLTFGQAVASMY